MSSLNSPTLVIDVAAISHNAEVLVRWLTPKGIDVIGVTKGTLGSVPIARAMTSPFVEKHYIFPEASVIVDGTDAMQVKNKLSVY